VEEEPERLSKRRRQDIQDEYEKCAALASGRQWIPTPEQCTREAEREARRNRRRIGRGRRGFSCDHHEGLSSDDEETTSQQVVYTDTITSVKLRAASTFDGVLDEYCHVDKIADKFLHWLSADPTSFREAYTALCLPKLISPIVRLYMLDWSPSRHEEEISSRNWYRQLLATGMDNVGVELETPEVVELIPSVVEKVLLPLLARILREQWDPISLKESQNCASLIRQLTRDFPSMRTSSKRVRELLETIWKRLKSMVADAFIPLYSKENIESNETGCRAFLNRQFWMSIKLIRCVLAFRGVLSDACLEELVVEDIINRCTVMALQVSIITEEAIVGMSLAVVKEIPKDWLPSSRPASYRPLVNFMSQVANIHENTERDLLKPIKCFIDSVGKK